MKTFTAANMRWVQRETSTRVMKKDPERIWAGLKYIFIACLVVVIICAIGA